MCYIIYRACTRLKEIQVEASMGPSVFIPFMNSEWFVYDSVKCKTVKVKNFNNSSLLLIYT